MIPYEDATASKAEIRRHEERFIDTYRRVGIEPFKQAVYGSESQAA